MNTALHPVPPRPLAGFTLIEIVIAVSIMAIVLVAVNAALFAAVHLRQRNGRCH